MTLLADFTVIQQQPKAVNNSLKLTFTTGGRHETGQAFIMLMVKGLNHNINAELRVNDHPGDSISASIEDDDKTNWWTHISVIKGEDLLDTGDLIPPNTLEIKTVGSDRRFFVKDVVCFFQQGADD